MLVAACLAALIATSELATLLPTMSAEAAPRSDEPPALQAQGGQGYRVFATREGLVGGWTSSGHIITPYDYFVSLPSCTTMSCPGASPGRSGMTNCGSLCFVKVTNPNTGACRTEPIYDVGPWFTVDDWWSPTEVRFLNQLPSNRQVLPQGLAGAQAAWDGKNVGYGWGPNGIGGSDYYSSVGNPAGIDLADGTYWSLGIGGVVGNWVDVEMLWQTGESPGAAAASCGHQLYGGGGAIPKWSPTPAPTVVLVSWGTAKVTGTGGGGLNCRTAPSGSGTVIMTFPEGATVTLRGPASNGWYPVICAGQAGYSSASYLSVTSTPTPTTIVTPSVTPTSTATTTSTATASPTATTTVTPTVTPTTTSTASPTSTTTVTPTATETVSPTGTLTATASPTPTGTTPPEATTTGTLTPASATPSVTATSTATAVSTDTPAPTPTPTGTQPPATATTTITTAPSPTTGAPPTVTPTSGPANWGSGIVSNTQGAGVNCRTSPSLSAGVIIVLAEGARVQLTGPATGGWQPVLCGGRQGYVSAPYLTTTQYTPTPASTATTAPVQTPASPATNQPTLAITPTTSVQVTTTAAPTGTPGFPNWGTGTVSNTQGAGVNCRTSPSLSAGVITVLPEGARVQLTGPASNGWQPVVCAGSQGYVSAPYLQAVAFTPTPGSAITPTGTTGPTTTATATRTSTIQNPATTTVAPTGTTPASPTASATGTPSLPNWGTGTVRNTGGLGVNCRTAPTTSSSVIRTLPEGSVVQLTGPASSGWQPVACNNRQGYISAQYLAAVAYTPTIAPTQSTSGAEALTTSETATTPGETPSIPDVAQVSTATASTEPSTTPVISPTDEPTSTPPPVPTEVPPTVVLPTPDLPDPIAEILPTEPPAPPEVVVTSAWVAGTNGQGLACLSAPSWDSDLLAVVPDGTAITRFGDPVDGWQAIGCGDQYGYVDANSLSEMPVEPAFVATEAAVTMPPEATELPVDTLDQGPVAAEPQTFQFAPIAETSVVRSSPDVPQAGVSGDQLLLGGPDGGMVVLTFAVSGIADGTVVDATLLVTGAGDGSGAGGTVLALPGVGIDPWSATTASVDALGGSGVGWLDTISPGAQTALDVTGVVANGTVTFVLTGTEAPVAIAGSASGAGPVLIVTAQPGG